MILRRRGEEKKKRQSMVYKYEMMDNCEKDKQSHVLEKKNNFEELSANNHFRRFDLDHQNDLITVEIHLRGLQALASENHHHL